MKGLLMQIKAPLVEKCKMSKTQKIISFIFTFIAMVFVLWIVLTTWFLLYKYAQELTLKTLSETMVDAMIGLLLTYMWCIFGKIVVNQCGHTECKDKKGEM